MMERKANLELEIQYQKEMLVQNISAQEKERERIAVLVHDDIGSKLNILSVWLNNPDVWNNQRSKEVVLQQIPVLLDAARNISHELYPVHLERLGFILSIEEIISNLNGALDVNFIHPDDYTSIGVEAELQMYRVVQEFVSNMLKHAEASLFTIIVRRSENYLSMLLADNGKGFDLDLVKRGMGLRNINLRIQSIGGFCKWKTIPEKNCRLIVTIPLKHE